MSRLDPTPAVPTDENPLAGLSMSALTTRFLTKLDGDLFDEDEFKEIYQRCIKEDISTEDMISGGYVLLSGVIQGWDTEKYDYQSYNTLYFFLYKLLSTAGMGESLKQYIATLPARRRCNIALIKLDDVMNHCFNQFLIMAQHDEAYQGSVGYDVIKILNLSQEKFAQIIIKNCRMRAVIETASAIRQHIPELEWSNFQKRAIDNILRHFNKLTPESRRQAIRACERSLEVSSNLQASVNLLDLCILRTCYAVENKVNDYVEKYKQLPVLGFTGNFFHYLVKQDKSLDNTVIKFAFELAFVERSYDDRKKVLEVLNGRLSHSIKDKSADELFETAKKLRESISHHATNFVLAWLYLHLGYEKAVKENKFELAISIIFTKIKMYAETFKCQWQNGLVILIGLFRWLEKNEKKVSLSVVESVFDYAKSTKDNTTSNTTATLQLDELNNILVSYMSKVNVFAVRPFRSSVSGLIIRMLIDGSEVFLNSLQCNTLLDSYIKSTVLRIRSKMLMHCTTPIAQQKAIQDIKQYLDKNFNLLQKLPEDDFKRLYNNVKVKLKDSPQLDVVRHIFKWVIGYRSSPEAMKLIEAPFRAKHTVMAQWERANQEAAAVKMVAASYAASNARAAVEQALTLTASNAGTAVPTSAANVMAAASSAKTKYQLDDESINEVSITVTEVRATSKNKMQKYKKDPIITPDEIDWERAYKVRAGIERRQPPIVKDQPYDMLKETVKASVEQWARYLKVERSSIDDPRAGNGLWLHNDTDELVVIPRKAAITFFDGRYAYKGKDDEMTEAERTHCISAGLTSDTGMLIIGDGDLQSMKGKGHAVNHHHVSAKRNVTFSWELGKDGLTTTVVVKATKDIELEPGKWIELFGHYNQQTLIQMGIPLFVDDSASVRRAQGAASASGYDSTASVSGYDSAAGDPAPFSDQTDAATSYSSSEVPSAVAPVTPMTDDVVDVVKEVSPKQGRSADEMVEVVESAPKRSRLSPNLFKTTGTQNTATGGFSCHYPR